MDRERLRTFIKGAALVLAVSALVVIDRTGAFCRGAAGPRLGQVAPDFVLPGLDGERVTLSGLRGQVVLLDFWATWCGACVKKMPRLEALQRELGPRGLKVLAINVEGEAEVVRRFVKRRPTRLKMLIDNGRLSEQYGIYNLPHLALIDRAGRLVHVQRGGRGEAELRRKLLQALEATPGVGGQGADGPGPARDSGGRDVGHRADGGDAATLAPQKR